MAQHPIAAALGVDEPLTHDLVSRAVVEHVAESEALDWKETYPVDRDEFAKDIAALANSRGGYLVYGVREDRRTSEAIGAVPVDVTDGKRRQLLAWANTRIDPPVTGIAAAALREKGGDHHGFLVVSVPASPDMPHFIGQQKALGVPYRNGTATAWMRERDIERAYRDRFSRRADEQAHLTSLVDQVVGHLDAPSVWLVAATVPTTNLDGYLDNTTKEPAVALLKNSQRVDIGPNTFGTLVASMRSDAAWENPRRGLRRWIFRSQSEYSPSALSSWSHLELHHDGSAVLAEQERAHDGGQGKQVLTDQLVVGFSFDLVRVIDAINAASGHTGDTLIKVEIVATDSPATTPIAMLAQRREGNWVLGHPEQPTWSRDLRQPLPMHGAVPHLDSPAERRDAARLIASDIASQFGHDVEDLPWPPPAAAAGGDT